MTPDKTTVTRFLYRPEAYGLLFRYQYEVQPGYRETADIISVAKWTEPAKPKKGAVRRPARKKA